MTTIITVQGSHVAWFDAERATVEISAAYDGPQRADVFERATQTAADVTATITPLHDAAAGPITWWSSDRVNVWSDRPWSNDRKRLPLVYHAVIGIRAKFSDFEALGRLIEQLAVMDGVNVGGITWDLTDERRKAVTDDVRRRAVQDAVEKASTYAAAAGVGAPLALSPEQIQVSSSVDVRFTTA